MPFDCSPSVKLSPAAKALLDAAMIAETRHTKHIRHSERCGTTYHCALGAIEVALGEGVYLDTGSNRTFGRACKALAAVIPVMPGVIDRRNLPWVIAAWNNAEGTTGPMVAAKMREAALLVRR